MKNVDLNYFPGWTRKSVTFTIDDGNIKMDKKFIDIVKPAGIVGTFNLHSTKALSPQEYRDFYRGFEIANHCKYHPRAFAEGQKYIIASEPLNRETSESYTDENPIVYKSEAENVYYIHTNKNRIKPDGWAHICEPEVYLQCADASRRELEEIFGEGSVKGFVWPYGMQPNPKLHEALRARGYNSLRRTGAVLGSKGYALPDDRGDWSYTAHNVTFLAEMEKYEAYPDDGELKFFSFGVHSIDFERSENWCDLVAFAEKYGNRPEDYYYASVSDIFEYEDAVKSVCVTDTEITNPSDRTLFIKVNGKRVTLAPKSTYQLS